MKKVTIFVSSPGDVIPERNITRQIIKKLQHKLAARLQIEGFFWEDEPVVATATFQTQFPRAAHADVFLCLMWSRIGTPLPEGAVFEDGTPILRADGSPYESGTIAEFEDAMTAYEVHQQPAILMYFKMAEVTLAPNDPHLQAKTEQYKAVKTFFNKWFQDEQGRFPRGCIEFSTLTEFANKIETHLCKLLVERFLPADSYSRKLCLLSWQGSPYLGLMPFNTEQAPIFFGRNQAIDEVYEVLRQRAQQHQAFVMILGLSGSGKSSLVCAGLLPLFAQLQIPYQVYRPSDIGAAMLIPALQHTISTIDANPNDTCPQAVLVIEQFEEIFTLPNITDEDREQFIQILAQTAITIDVKTGLPEIWILTTLRSELLYRCHAHPVLADLIQGQGCYVLSPPTPSELRQIIEEPAIAAGLVFEHPERQTPLDELIFDEMADHSTNLALLQFTLQRLYEHRREDTLTYQAYQEMGGITGALAQHAENVFEQLSPHAQMLFPFLMRTLVTVDKRTGAPLLGRRILSDMVVEGGRELISTLTQARLLITDKNESEQAVACLAHEALLAHWPRLQTWWEENRELLHIRLRVSDAASYWQAEGRPDNLLLREGKALNDARRLVELWPNAIMQEMRDYVHLSQYQVEHQHQVEITRTRNKLHRSQQVTGVMGILMISAVISSLYGYIGQQQAEQQTVLARQQAEAAEQARGEAEHAAQRALRNQSLFLAQRAEVELDQGNATKASLLALEALPHNMAQPNRPYLPTAEVALYYSLMQLREQKLLTGHTGTVHSVIYSHDMKHILTLSSNDAVARVWTQQGDSAFNLVGHQRNVITAAYSADNSYIATIANDRFLNLWSAQDGQLLQKQLLSQYSINFALFNQDASLALVITNDKRDVVQLWDVAQQRLIRQFSQQPVTISALAISQDGQRFATANEDLVIHLWNIVDTQPYAVMQGHIGDIQHLLWNQNSNRLLSLSDDGSALLWDTQAGEQLLRLAGHTESLLHAAFSADERWIATSGRDGQIFVWDAQTGEVKAHWDDVGLSYFLTFSPDDRYLLGSLSDTGKHINMICAWDYLNNSVFARLGGHEQTAKVLAFSPDGKQFISGGSDHTARLWSLDARLRLLLLGDHDAVLNRAHFSPNGQIIATASTDHTAKLWSTQTGNLLHTLKSHQRSINDIAFSPDGQQLATAASDKTVKLWQVADGQLLKTFDTHESWVVAVQFSADGRYLLIGDWNGLVQVWDLVRDRLQWQIHTQPDTLLHSLQWSPDNRWFVSNTRQVVTLWSMETGKVEYSFSFSNTTEINSVDFSADSQWLALGAGDKASVWSVTTGKQYAEFNGHTDEVMQVRFSPDQQFLATASQDRSVRLWSLPERRLHAVLTGHSGWVMDVNFANNSQRLASVSWDGSVILWDVHSSQSLGKWKNTNRPLLDVTFSPDDRQILVSGNLNTAFLWPVFPSTQAIIDFAQANLPRQLSIEERQQLLLD